MVKTCDYLYLNNEIYFAKPLEMSGPCAGRMLLNNPIRCLYITLLNVKPRSPAIATVYIYAAYTLSFIEEILKLTSS